MSLSRTRQQQIREVGAGDQQHQRGHSEEHPQRHGQHALHASEALRAGPEIDMPRSHILAQALRVGGRLMGEFFFQRLMT